MFAILLVLVSLFQPGTMQLNPAATLDTSTIEDTRGSSATMKLTEDSIGWFCGSNGNRVCLLDRGNW